MNYVQFLLVFLVAPGALLVALHGQRHLRLLVLVLAASGVLALVYTVPWAYVLVTQHVWQFDRFGTGPALWHIPWEFFLWVVLQVVFTGTLTALALRHAWGRS